jgi:DNA-binding transcriptional LysR family regulator
MDLNLYLVFLAVMRHGSASRAAYALGLTQPAVSNALTRLRDRLGDPLFVRAKNGMLPTRFALDIAPEVERSVEILQAVAQRRGETDDDAPLSQLKRRFVLVMADMEESLLLPDLVAAFAKSAPGISVDATAFRRDSIQDDLELGRADFILAFLPFEIKNLISHPVVEQDFVCLCRAGHPTLGEAYGLTLEAYTGTPHILVSPDRGGARGVIDEVLQNMGAGRRQVTCTLPHFLPACLLAARTDYLLTVPRRVAQLAVEQFGLVPFELPLESPKFTIGLHWHRTRDGDPEHRAFRDIALAAFEKRFSSA